MFLLAVFLLALGKLGVLAANTCYDIGCGVYGDNSCACDWACAMYDDCCDDACSVCGFGRDCNSDQASCQTIGCGSWNQQFKCGCDKNCRAYNDCCDDVCNFCHWGCPPTQQPTAGDPVSSPTRGPYDGDQPNFVLIFPDNMGVNGVGWNNKTNLVQGIYTPNMDWMAYNGIILGNYYAGTVCCPARAALLTGRYNLRMAMQHGDLHTKIPTGVPLNETLLPEVLKDAGYISGGFGKWDMGAYSWGHVPPARGFDDWAGPWSGVPSRWTHQCDDGYNFFSNYSYYEEAYGNFSGYVYRDRAIDFVRNRAEDGNPFFLWIDLDMPHDPYKVPQKYYNYVCNQIDCRRRMQEDPEDEVLGESHEEEDKSLGLYAMTYFMDDLAGDVYEALEDTGLMDNTYFIFLADHSGDDADYINYPYAGGKGTNYEGGRHLAGMIYSPLIPEESRGTWYNGFVTLEDIFPTIAALAGVDDDVLEDLDLDGMALGDYIFGYEDVNDSPRTEFLLNIDPYAMSCQDYDWGVNDRRRLGDNGVQGGGGGISPAAGYRLGDLKFMVQCISDYSSYSYYLYNITADPTESNNLAGSDSYYADEIDYMLEKMEYYGSLMVAPYLENQPYQTWDYFCAYCDEGSIGDDGVWWPWVNITQLANGTYFAAGTIPVELRGEVPSENVPMISDHEAEYIQAVRLGVEYDGPWGSVRAKSTEAKAARVAANRGASSAGISDGLYNEHDSQGFRTHRTASGENENSEAGEEKSSKPSHQKTASHKAAPMSEAPTADNSGASAATDRSSNGLSSDKVLLIVIAVLSVVLIVTGLALRRWALGDDCSNIGVKKGLLSARFDPVLSKENERKMAQHVEMSL